MRIGRGVVDVAAVAVMVVATAAVALLASGPALAESACPKGAYDDTKHRFCIKLESGWQLAPMPGDTEGMVFKKVVDGVPGILRVSVHDIQNGEDVKTTLDAEEAGAKNEIGYKAGTDTPASVGLLAA